MTLARARQDRSEGHEDQPSSDHDHHLTSLVDIAERLPEVALITLGFCSALAIARLKETCRALRNIAEDPDVWKQICLSVYRYIPQQATYDALAEYNSWANMFMTRPRVRLDGAFVVSCVLIKYGTPVGRGMQEAGQDFYKPVFHVVHTRYLRFYSDGTLITILTAENPRHALKAINAARAGKAGSCGVGTFVQNGDKIQCNFEIRLETHPRMLPIQQSYRLQILSTKRGAWNRLKWLEHNQINNDGSVHAHPVAQQPFRFVGFERFTDKVGGLVCDGRLLNTHLRTRAAVVLG